MGADVPNLEPPQTYDIGSQFETYSSRIGRINYGTNNPAPTESTLSDGYSFHPSRVNSDDTTTLVGDTGDQASTIYTSQYGAYSEDGLDDDDEHAGMNYQMLLNHPGINPSDTDEPVFQNSKYIS